MNISLLFKGTCCIKDLPKKCDINKVILGTSLAVQWLGLCAPTAGGAVSNPVWGTDMPRGMAKKEKKSNT